MSTKTPVTILQEFMVKRKEIPDYDLIYDGTGSHEPLFKFKVTGLDKMAIGSGKSKKEAKHEAARLLLHILKDDTDNIELKENPLLQEVDGCFSPFDDTIKDNAVGALQIFCAEYHLMTPRYELTLDIGPPHSKLFSIRCTVSSFTYESTARTKKQAKHRCSAGLLEKLKLCLSDYISPGDRSENYLNVKDESASELAKRTSHLGFPLKDLYDIFVSPYFPESPTLDNLKKNHNNFHDSPNLFDNLKAVCDELNFELDIIELECIENETVIVNVFLVAKPGWSFLGLGKDYKSAVNDAIYQAFEFLFEVTTNKKIT